MRIAMCLCLLLIGLAGCSRQPELTPEQVRAAKFLEENFDPRIYVINDRLGKLEVSDEDSDKWLSTLIELLNQFNIRKAEQGHEAAMIWFDAESKKTANELITAWGPNDSKQP
jgi:hypothetical protein